MTDATYVDPAAADPWAQAPDDEFARFRPERGRFLNRWSVLLTAIVLGVAGFYAGVRVEKTHVTGASASVTRPSFAGGGFAGAGGPGGGTSGTVTGVDGDTIYVKESSGDTVAVKLAPTTTITKSESVGRVSVHPGDTVAITGSTTGRGTVKATAVTDSGSSSSSSTSSSGSTSTRSGAAVASG